MIPMTVISGYLGAGKTTFLNRLLSDPCGKSFAVLVNDFGEIALDEQLIDFQDGDLIALRNGCVCCQIGDDLLDAIDGVLRRDNKPDQILLEASGVSNPAKLIQIAKAEPDLIPAGVLTLVDALNYSTQRNDPLLADTIQTQIAAANQVLITKADLISEAQKTAVLTQLHIENPKASIVLSAKDIPANFELPDTAIRPTQTPALHPRYATWSYQGNAAIDLEALAQVCVSQTGKLLRLKGFINTYDGARNIVHFSGSHWNVQTAESPGPTELVAIGHAGGFDAVALGALTQ